MKDKEVSLGVSQERGELYYVPGTGEKLVRLRTISSPVPGTFTPKLGCTLCLALCLCLLKPR